MKAIQYILVTVFLAASYMVAQNEQQIIDLRGNWKFEIGDQKKYADPKFDDSKWAEIFVPADWENEGYPGYDGFGWYRKNFVIPETAKEKRLYFHIVADDACNVYVNGHLIGEGGSCPPQYQTAYNIEHKFFIPPQFLNFGEENTIAVRVYDETLNGGIVRGKTGIYEYAVDHNIAVQLPDVWKFKKGDSEQWKDPNLDDSKWQELIVPAKWDAQGYRNYDGFGWYRVSFVMPSQLKDETVVLLLGRIDDIDQTYVNGELIGETGKIRSDGSVRRINQEYREFRGYEIPNAIIKYGQKNTIAVRVFDNMVDGGIYEGPIGIMKEKDYRRFKRTLENQYRDERNKFERFLDKIFND